MKTPATIVPKDLIARVEDKVLETYIKAEDIWQRQFELPRLQFDLRGVCAGYANLRQNLICLNPLLLVENQNDFVAETVPHEAAHLITHRLHGNLVKSHGREWKSVMVELGLEPVRCHNYDVTKATVRRERRFLYSCGCRTVQEPARTHFKVQRGKIYFTCSYCGERFKFTPDTANRETVLNAQARP